jgi:hypothetical protein
MGFRADKVDSAVSRLDGLVAGMLPRTGVGVHGIIARWRGDAAALRFHLARRLGEGPVIVAVLGGTGTGKSTIVNRILGATVSATSFRRTFTSGAVAVGGRVEDIPAEWLGIEHEVADPGALPARGRVGALIVVGLERDILRRIVVVDTPDLDGDQPAHHAEADRAFRWADAVLVLVTPEKYQMTELMPYYRLAERYGTPALFLMNKCEQLVVADDYERLLRAQGVKAEGKLFVVPRDDAGFEPAQERNLEALRGVLGGLSLSEGEARTTGLANRSGDLLGRLDDQILGPLRHNRAEIDKLIATLRQMENAVPGVDVNPLTQQLQRRMQQRSVLYLMGPQRILERVRQAPGLLVRLPRVAWDYVLRGEISAGALGSGSGGETREVPNFQTVLIDQFNVIRSRLDDVLRSGKVVHMPDDPAVPPPYRDALIDPSEAGKIADEELAELKSWLEQRWNATPRDTRMLESLLKFLPGGRKITQWTEAAPYLLVLVVAAATHHLFGGLDLAVLGGWSVATWLTERLSNEVASHTRATNQKITDRFAQLGHEQIEKLCRWLDEQAPKTKTLEQLERAMGEAREVIEG